MNVSYLSIKSHTYNEDRFAVSDRVFVVIDGATTLEKRPNPRKRTNASYLVSRLKKEILRHKRGFDTDFFRALSKRIYEEGRIGAASAGLAGVAIQGENFRLFSLGDCEVICKLRSGEIFRFKRNDLDKLDGYALAEMVRISKEKGISVKESRAYITDILLRNREKKNKAGGYDVFEPMQEPTFSLFVKDIPIKDVESFYVCSDGFAQCFTTLDIFSSCRDLFKTTLNIRNICKKIRDVSFSDPEYNAFPRFKIVDDITVIKAEF